MSVGDILIEYYAKVLPTTFNLLLKIVAALIIILFGWLIAWLVDYIIRVSVERLKINEFLRKFKFGQYFERENIAVKVESVLGLLAFWLIFGIFLMSAFDVLGLSAVNQFISRVINYIPTALVGALILLIAIFVGDLVNRGIYISLKGSGIRSIGMVAGLAKWSIVVFGFLMALSQWGIAQDLVNILVSGIIAFLVLSGGLAFGLGGQDVAREILENLRRDLKK